jgi:hypothetical protein
MPTQGATTAIERPRASGRPWRRARVVVKRKHFFFERKEKPPDPAADLSSTPTPCAKVFWFFFSKKNCLA